MNVIHTPQRNQKDQVPYRYYLDKYRGLNPQETAQRCGLPYNAGNAAFSLRLMGRPYRVPFPAFTLVQEGAPPEKKPQPIQATEKVPPEYILILRYLCEGRYTPPAGKPLSYNEVPWGGVYYRNFEGRCLKRLAYGFGADIGAFKALMEGTAEFRAELLPQGDAGYRLEFINGLFINLLLWGADDEFPPSAQILFDDNFIFAFTAEDLAVVGEVAITILKERFKARK
ncbi:MAG: DUF3786 domain-containing protein [Treponema sp.]|jgi:hypothetical protein|nr:DUF3786 domain-containing protein [Treponema sp.]